ncbi:MAG: hypothetical protein ACR2PR_09175 [Pseudohongiellaceae bacterium]
MTQKYEGMPLTDEAETQVPRLVRNFGRLINETPADIPNPATATTAEIAEKVNQILRHLRGAQ